MRGSRSSRSSIGSGTEESSLTFRSRVQIRRLQRTSHLPPRLAAVTGRGPLIVALLLVPEELLHSLAELASPPSGRGVLLKKCLKSLPESAIHREIKSLRCYGLSRLSLSSPRISNANNCPSASSESS